MAPSLTQLCSVLMCVLGAHVTSADFNLTILHTNDIHSRIEQTSKYSGACSEKDVNANKCYGGYARLRTMVEQKRRQFPGHVVLLDGGDQFQGTLWFTVFQGGVIARLMNLLQYDAMAVGNHEFDDGVPALRDFANQINFSLLSSNMDLGNTPSLRALVAKSTILERGGERIGVVGYTTTETAYISQPGTVRFLDELESVQAEIDALTRQGVDKIIAVGHAGFTVDKQIAENLRDIDVVVGGHSNTFLYTGEDPSNEDAMGPYPHVATNVNDGHSVLVVQDYAYSKYLGELHVTFNGQGHVTSWSGNPVLLDGSVAEDNQTLDVIREFLPNITTFRTNVVGQSHVLLSNDKCRLEECSMGNVVTDAMVRQNIRHSDARAWSDVTMAFMNSGGIRTTVERGNITVEHILQVLPFRNTVSIIVISGQTLMAILEQSAATYSEEDPDGGFLQWSGLQVTYDMTRPLGSRVIDAQATCSQCLEPRLEAIQLSAHYSMLTNDFLIGGGDGYSMIQEGLIEEHRIGDTLADTLVEYMTATSPIITGVQGRVRVYTSGRPAPSMCQGQGQGVGDDYVSDRASRVYSSLFVCLSVVCHCVWLFLIR